MREEEEKKRTEMIVQYVRAEQRKQKKNSIHFPSNTPDCGALCSNAFFLLLLLPRSLQRGEVWAVDRRLHLHSFLAILLFLFLFSILCHVAQRKPNKQQ
jgi:hypothetical protein